MRSEKEEIDVEGDSALEAMGGSKCVDETSPIGGTKTENYGDENKNSNAPKNPRVKRAGLSSFLVSKV